MKTIIFIGTNKSGSSRDAIRAAEQLGYFTVVFTNNEKQLQQRKEYVDVHEMILIDTKDLDKMTEEIRNLQARGLDIKLIVSFVDSYVHIASLLCDKFCQNYTSSRAIQIMENKEDTRLVLMNEPYTPQFIVIPSDADIPFESINERFNYPIIVKTSNSTGSKDVLLANDKAQLENYIAKLVEKNPDDNLILEEFIQGNQYLVEVLVQNGKAMIAGVMEQEITKGKRFIITGYGVMAEVPDQYKKEIERVLESIISNLGIINGALHLEMRRTSNGWKLIEINPRISGGAMNKMLQAAFGYSLVEETLKLYLGEEPSLERKQKKYVFTQYVIVSKKGLLEKVTGKAKARKSPGVVEVYVKPKKGTRLIPPLSMGHRYAYVIAAGNSMEEARIFAKNAAKEIQFHLMEETDS